MHIFLTGDKQVGKSTIIDRVLESTGLRPGGFRTAFGPQRFTADEQYLYMRRADRPMVMDEEHAIAYMSEFQRQPFPEKFDMMGKSYVGKAGEYGAEVIIADECAFLERDALEFQQCVLDALDGELPVFGVIRKDIPGWTKKIVAHDNVKLIEVTVENRDELVDEIAAELLRQTGKIV